MTADFDCDVVVAGLGPVGATLSALLGQAGARVVAVDKDMGVYPLPRAAHFDHEIMRIFQAIGIAEEVSTHARPAPAYEFRTAKGEVLLRYELAQHSPSGWPQSFMFHQPGVERALRKKLAADPNVQVRLGTSFEGFARFDGGLFVSLSSGEDSYKLKTRYLIGCDGASSAVRASSGIELTDFGFDEPWLVIDAIVGPDAVVPDVNIQLCDPARPTTCVLMGPGRHRWEFMLKPGEVPSAMLADDVIEKMLEPWGVSDKITIDRKAVYRFHGLIAKSWRRDHILLAGDAAHQMPPFAGQGMCSGLRDAANLAWKLALVLSGDASESIFDTYLSEREPHVRAILETSIAMGRVVCTQDVSAAAQRDAALLAQRASGHSPVPLPSPRMGPGLTSREAHGAGELFIQPWSQRDGEMRRFDDCMPKGAWLILRDGASKAARLPPFLSQVDIAAPHLAPFAISLRAWLDTHDADAVLVRPDRYVFGAGAVEDLVAEFSRALGAGA
jgi:3-(3-hydroxy-phenyl)propionate hydroxylase